jgi:HSP20 family molecular chaperone IbpA
MMIVNQKPDPSRPKVTSLYGQSFYHYFGNFGWHLPISTNTRRPPTDVFEIEDSYCVRIEIAGMYKDDFVVTFQGQHLFIHGMRRGTSEKLSYHQMETDFGDIATEVAFTSPIISKKCLADYHEGCLCVILPIKCPNNIRIDKKEF